MSDVSQVRLRIPQNKLDLVGKLPDKGAALVALARAYADSGTPWEQFLIQLKDLAYSQNHSRNAQRIELQAHELKEQLERERQELDQERREFEEWKDEGLQELYAAAMHAALTGESIEGVDEWARKFGDTWFVQLFSIVLQEKAKTYEGLRSMLFLIVTSIAAHMGDKPDEFDSLSQSEQLLLIELTKGISIWSAGASQVKM